MLKSNLNYHLSCCKVISENVYNCINAPLSINRFWDIYHFVNKIPNFGRLVEPNSMWHGLNDKQSGSSDVKNILAITSHSSRCFMRYIMWYIYSRHRDEPFLCFTFVQIWCWRTSTFFVFIKMHYACILKLCKSCCLHVSSKMWHNNKWNDIPNGLFFCNNKLQPPFYYVWHLRIWCWA